MSVYPPSSSSHPYAAEEYELPTYNHSSPPRPSSPSRPSPLRQRSSLPRVLTIHPGQSTSHLLFARPSAFSPNNQTRVRHVRSSSIPQSPDETGSKRYSRAHFLHEDLDAMAPATEEVQLPDFGQMLGFNPEAGEDHYAVAQRMTSRWKRRLYLLMEEPSSGREAFFVHVVVTGAIIFSAILTTFSTLPSFHTNPASIRTLFGLDTTIVVLFTVEYIVRSLAHSDTLTQYYNWSTSFFGLLDLISILPYYIEVARDEDTSILFRFSILRTFRLLRVFRAFKYQNQMLLTIEVMYVAVYRSKDALLALSFFLLLVLVFFSTLIYFAERGTWDATLGGFVDADGDPSAFDSIPQTAWFSLVTMSTVGYGEVVPKSFMGKMLTVPLLMFGLLLIALPSFVLGRNFAIVFDAMTSQLNRAVSEVESPRESLSESITQLPTSVPPVESLLLGAGSSAQATPYFSQPSSSNPGLSSSGFIQPNSYPSNPNIRKPFPGTSPNPEPIITSGNRGSVTTQPRMWDGVDGMGVGGGAEGKAAAGRDRDITNIKLAKNQLVLLEQIDSLRQTIDRQGDILNRVMTALDLNPPKINLPVSGHQNEQSRRSASTSRRPSSDSRINGGLVPETPNASRRKGKTRDPGQGEEEQFALGDSDEDGGAG